MASPESTHHAEQINMSPEVYALERIVFQTAAHPRLRKSKLPLTAVMGLLAELRRADIQIAELRERLRKYEEAEKPA